MAPISTGQLENDLLVVVTPPVFRIVTLGPWLVQVHTYPVGRYMEQLVRLSSCGHTPTWSSVQGPRVALSPWLAQVVLIYPVATGTAHNNFI